MDPIIILGLGGGLALIMLLVGVITSISSERSAVEERMGEIVDQSRPKQPRNQAPAPVTDWLNRRVEGSSTGDKISKTLARADLKMKPGEYIALIVISTFAVGLILYLLGGRSTLSALIGAVIGLFLPGMYVKRLQGKRLIRFSEQLPDMLNLMVNGLRAGYSTMQAMEAVSKELPTPICDEFRRVVQEMQLGISMEKALDNLLRRIPSDDLDLCITAMNVQREVGGNLAEILDTISYTIRERVRVKGEIRVLVSQVKYSGSFLSLMPIFVILILYFLNREYMMEFFKSENVPCGYISLGLSAFLIILGYFAMQKLADIEI